LAVEPKAGVLAHVLLIAQPVKRTSSHLHLDVDDLSASQNLHDSVSRVAKSEDEARIICASCFVLVAYLEDAVRSSGSCHMGKLYRSRLQKATAPAARFGPVEDIRFEGKTCPSSKAQTAAFDPNRP
jgi:hypothetical protein